MPAVSVIIPNYNHALYLRQRIDSVLNQSYTDFEVIILDDCSQDESREIIEGYRYHPKIKSIVFNEKNSGNTFMQWNHGVQLAGGDYIWIAESDDWCEPGFLQTLMGGVTDASAVAMSQSLVVSDSGKVLWNSRASKLEETRDGIEYIQTNMLKENSIFNASMCIFRREHFRQVDPEFATYRFCGDWFFWVHILLQGDIFISGKVLNYFRKHGDDVSGKAYKSGLYYEEYFRIVDHFESKNIIASQTGQILLEEKCLVLLKDKIIDPLAKRALKESFRQRLGGRYRKVLRQFALLRVKQKGRDIFALGNRSK